MGSGPCFHGRTDCVFCPPARRRARPRRCAACGRQGKHDLCRACAHRGFLPLALFYSDDHERVERRRVAA